jgi:hypothetical protein
MADGLALRAEVRGIDVAESIRGIGHHLQRTVADEQIAGCGLNALVCGSLRRSVGR